MPSENERHLGHLAHLHSLAVRHRISEQIGRRLPRAKRFEPAIGIIDVTAVRLRRQQCPGA